MKGKYETREKQNRDCIEIEEYYSYKSIRTEISAFLYLNLEDGCEISDPEYVLLVAENEVENDQKELSDSVIFSYHMANPQNDWIFIIILR